MHASVYSYAGKAGPVIPGVNSGKKEIHTFFRIIAGKGKAIALAPHMMAAGRLI
jgi:hypothetical protein